MNYEDRIEIYNNRLEKLDFFNNSSLVIIKKNKGSIVTINIIIRKYTYLYSSKVYNEFLSEFNSQEDSFYTFENLKCYYIPTLRTALHYISKIKK
jgi:hypothetical protein